MIFWTLLLKFEHFEYYFGPLKINLGIFWKFLDLIVTFGIFLFDPFLVLWFLTIFEFLDLFLPFAMQIMMKLQIVNHLWFMVYQTKWLMHDEHKACSVIKSRILLFVVTHDFTDCKHWRYALHYCSSTKRKKAAELYHSPTGVDQKKRLLTHYILYHSKARCLEKRSNLVPLSYLYYCNISLSSVCRAQITI